MKEVGLLLRHVVMFKMNESAPAGTMDSLEEGLLELSKTISEIENYQYGADLSLRDGNFDFCLVAEFADREAFDRYAAHPKHLAFIEDRLTPVVSKRVSVQYEI
jgi:Stress responsive A/B Barrel Domain